MGRAHAPRGPAALGEPDGPVIAGIADGALLPAILLVRTAHERGAVFTTAASLKVGAGAVGGVLIGAAGAGVALLAAAALQVAGAAICLGRRYASGS